MPTAATEIPTETVTFNSKSPNLALTRRPPRKVDDGMGGKIAQGFEEWVERQREQNHQRELAGLEPLPIDETPWKVEFHHHVFKTSDSGLIAWLRSHKNFNTNGPTGFYEAGAAPDEPKPTLNEQMTAIIDAQAELDVDRLTALIDAERGTHNRPAVLQAAEAALRKLAEGAPEPGADAGTGNGDSSSTSPPSPNA